MTKKLIAPECMYEALASQVADDVIDEQVLPSGDLAGFNDEQIEVLAKWFTRVASEGILTGIGLGCDHPDLNLAMVTDVESMDLQAVMDIAGLDDFHRGYLQAELDRKEEGGSA